MVVKNLNLVKMTYKVMFVGLLFFSLAIPAYCDVFADINFSISGGDPLSESTVLAGFENANLDTAQNQLVWTDEAQNNAFIQAYNYTIASNLGLTTDAIEGSKALKLSIDFGQDVASANNWGAFLMLMRSKNQALVPYNASSNEAISFYAKAENPAENLEIAVAITEYNANSALAESWISKRATLTNSYIAYSFGLNQQAFSLQDGSPVGNGIIDTNNIKIITIFIYKDGNKGLQNVLIDKICFGEDQIKPKIKSVEGLADLIQKGNFTVTINVEETGGLNYSTIPQISLVPTGSNAINFTIATYNNNLIVANGNVPTTVKVNSGRFVISGITDFYGNTMDSYTKELSIDSEATYISTFENLDNIMIINTANALAIENKELRVSANFLASNQENWGCLVQVEVPQAMSNFSAYSMIMYKIKADAATTVKTKIALIEDNGETWIQTATYNIGTEYMNAGTKLSQDRFYVDAVYSTPVNKVLDLNKIKYVQIYVLREGTNQAVKVNIDDLKLSNIDTLPPVTPIVNNGIDNITVLDDVTVTYNMPADAVTLNITANIANITYNINQAQSSIYLANISSTTSIIITAKDASGNASLPFIMTVYKGSLSMVVAPPVLDNLPDVSVSSNIDISGQVNSNISQVSLFVNGNEYATQNVVNKKFLFSQVGLTKAINNIAVYAKNSIGIVSQPVSKNIGYTYYNSLDQLDTLPTENIWGVWGFAEQIEKVDINGNKLLKVTQDFDKKVIGDSNWGAIIWKSVPAARKDFSDFDQITYKMYNDDNHKKVIVRLGLIEKSGETWFEVKEHNLTSANQTIKVALNETDFMLDATYNPTVNGKFDLTDISYVIVYILSNGSTGNHTAYIDEIKLGNSSTDNSGTANIIQSGPLVAPLLRVRATETSVKNIEVTGNVSGSNATSILLYINNKWVKSTNVTAGTFQFQNVSLSATENNLTARSADSAGRLSNLSASIKVTLVPKEFEGSLTAYGEGKPVYISFPIGSLENEADPEIEQIALEQKPELAVNMPKGRKITDGSLQILDIILAEQLLQPITIKIPVAKNSADIEPWYYNPTSAKWTQEGISNWYVTTNAVFDTLENTWVEASYLVFTTTHLSIYGVFEKTDKNFPQVSNIKFDNKTIYEGDYVQTSPLFGVSFSDNATNDAGISSWNVKAVNAENEAEQILIGENKLTEPTASYTISYNGFKLDDGKTYFVKITLADAAGNVTVNNTKTFLVSKTLKISDCLNGPNPFNPDNNSTEIQYQLSKNADVDIYIFDIAGRKVWETKIAAGFANGGTAGFNSVTWDGQDLYQQVVANGVYIAYIIAKDGANKKIAKVKMAVLR
jgi:hypothetical protein